MQHNKNFTKKTLLISLLAPFVGYSQSLQSSQNIDDKKPIILTSTYKVPTKKDNTGSSVITISKKDIENSNAEFINDLLQNTPSLIVNSNGGRGQANTVYLRGSGNGRVKYIVDGIEQKDPSAISGGFDISHLSLDDVEQIEILRGEQSALWGSDAMGGVINITTKSGKNATKPFNANIELGAGSHNSKKANVNIYGKKSGFFYSLKASKYKTNGISARSFYTDFLTGKKIKATENDAYDNASLGFNLGYDFNKQAGIEAVFHNTKTNGDYDPFSAPDDTKTGLPKYKTNHTDFKLKGYLNHTNDTFKHSVFITKSNTKRKFNSAFGENKFNGKSQKLGYQLDIEFDKTGNITQGLSFAYEYETNKSTESKSDINKITQKSFIGEYRLFHKDNHSFSVGVRHDENSKYDNETTFKISGGYRINDNFRIHSSIGTGIKNPTLDLLSYNADNGYSNDLETESSLGADLGILFETSNKKHSLDVTYFQRKINNSLEFNLNNYSYYNIDGTKKIKGLELSYKGEINDKFSLNANYTYTQSKDETGKYSNRIPKSQASISTVYKPIDAVKLNSTIRYIGSRPDGNKKMKSYAVADFGASYKFKKNYKVYLKVNNVFDKKYENVHGYSADGRNFFVGFKASF